MLSVWNRLGNTLDHAQPNGAHVGFDLDFLVGEVWGQLEWSGIFRHVGLSNRHVNVSGLQPRRRRRECDNPSSFRSLFFRHFIVDRRQLCDACHHQTSLASHRSTTPSTVSSAPTTKTLRNEASSLWLAGHSRSSHRVEANVFCPTCLTELAPCTDTA